MTLTPLEFYGDAISLSGLTGTKLKCDVIGIYYPFWWKITSGGASREYQWPTAIVELNAATGEVYVKDSQETVLGSARAKKHGLLEWQSRITPVSWVKFSGQTEGFCWVN